jgi:hypothetical protein
MSDTKEVRIEHKAVAIHTLQNEIVRGKILEAALKDLQARPGFNPAAISIVFGLKW